MLKRSAAVIALALAAASAPVSAQDAPFLAAIDDVPLASGLAEDSEPVVFESDQGRVVRTSAAGEADYDRLREFYLASLPQLGWERQPAATPEEGAHGPMVFVREYERLTVSVEPAAGVDAPVNVVFELVVKLASTRLPG